jgi:hypothetical protein
MFMPYDKETRQLVNKARLLGKVGEKLSVYLEDHQLLRICAVVANDLNKQHLVKGITSGADLSSGYYGVPLEWFNLPTPKQFNFVETFLLLRREIPDFATYFQKLCELHKRRLKFELILEHQALPQMEQIVPRCLLEFGLRPSETLASWLVWRKWLYDIDNRSAQEAGYLFEPILAAAIGGVPFSAKTSPVRRADKPRQGRQVDCLDERQAYEFKMRVTIAASRQGRLREELDFARDCHTSGFTPILLVLDPTPSVILTELETEYVRYGGRAYIGDAAWQHIEDKAGEVMGKFVEKYVRTPLREIDHTYTTLQPIHLLNKENEISIQVGSQIFSIPRTGEKIDFEEAEDEDEAGE